MLNEPIEIHSRSVTVGHVTGVIQPAGGVGAMRVLIADPGSVVPDSGVVHGLISKATAYIHKAPR